MILEKSEFVRYYTFLDALFNGIEEFRKSYWLISDHELNHDEAERLNSHPVLISGEKLRKLLSEVKTQFIWGVLSAFENPEIDLNQPLPFADGNPEFWSGSPRPQHPDASFEIVCWDSSCTLFVGVNSRVAVQLKKIFPDIKDLDMENQRRVS